MSLREHIIPVLKKHKIKIGLSIVFLVFWLFCIPDPLFDVPTSTVVESREGLMLGARIADDGQWRFPEMDSVPYRFEQCILHFEDEYFYEHPGFNPVSMAKAFWQNLTTDRRRGGSTLTQQVIRLSRKNKKRSYFEKLIEIIKATRIEVGYSKEEILALYTSYAPFGGNVVGLETASWRYFGISASDLSWGQSASLAVLPNAPSLIFPGKNEEILKRKRDALLLKLFEKEVIDRTTYELALMEPLPGKPHPLPDIAPHFTEKIRKEYKGERIRSTLDISLQNRINQIAKNHYYSLNQNQIHNLAVLVIRVDTREVISYIGNSPTSRENDNYVDIIQRSRSTGSILKPFLYASLLDSGELLPNTLVSDIPTTINGYQPNNFNREYNGAVPASVALSRSLNVPAVRMLSNFGLQRFYSNLKEVNLKSINKPANHYGLSLILGGAESSLWEVTNAYAGLASTLNFFNRSSSEYRTNEFGVPVYTIGRAFDHGDLLVQAPIFDAGSIYHTFNSLQEVNRPQGEENWSFFSSSQKIAWKTGTSFGFKDAWAVGVTPQFAIGIWVGNSDGEGRPGLTGIQAAAPLLFDVLKVLPGDGHWFDLPYDELIEGDVCKNSGYLANVYCDDISKDWIPRKGLKTMPCSYHQKIFLTSSESYRVNSSCYPLSEMKQKNWFVLPPVMEYYYAPLHPEYSPLPDFLPGCYSENEQKMQFIYPKKNEVILLPKDFDEELNEVIFKLAHNSPQTVIYWYLDSKFVGMTETFHEIALAPEPGVYTLSVVDQDGNEMSQKMEIKRASN